MQPGQPPSLREADWPHRLHTSARACPHLRDHSRRNRRARRSRAQCNGQRCKTQTCVADAPCGAIAAHLASRLFAERAAQLPECCPAICMHGPQLLCACVRVGQATGETSAAAHAHGRGESGLCSCACKDRYERRAYGSAGAVGSAMASSGRSSITSECERRRARFAGLRSCCAEQAPRGMRT